MSWLLSIDPGLRACGCALWKDAELRAAALVRAGNQKAEPLALAVYEAVTGVRQWLDDQQVEAVAVRIWMKQWNIFNADLVVELPQTYGGRASRGDANDLIALGAVVGALHARLGGSTTMYVTPSEWKGGAKKLITEARLREDLTPRELARMTLPRGKKAASNVWDAVGIGYWWLKGRGLR